MYFLLERLPPASRPRPAEARSALVADYLFEKDKIFAYINLSDDELRLYDGYYELLRSRFRRPTW